MDRTWVGRGVMAGLLALASAAAQAGPDWSMCPAAPDNGDKRFNLLMVQRGDGSSAERQAFVDAHAAVQAWCPDLIFIGDWGQPEPGVFRTIYAACYGGDGKLLADGSGLPRHRDVHWCGGGASPAVSTAATAGARAATSAGSVDKPAPPTCSDRDIEGRWTRTDGAIVDIQAMRLNGGGRALMFSHPSQWPRTVFKFSGIRHREGCQYDAVCHTVHRNGGNGGYNVSESACRLDLDKAAGTLVAPGNHGRFRR